MKRVLFLCNENSCRSQMAEAITRHFWGDKLEPYSAGLAPKKVHPMALEALNELGIRNTGQLFAKSLDQFLDKEFHLVITLCDNAQEGCPSFIWAEERYHLPFKDPSKRKDGGHREIKGRFVEVAKEIRGELERLFRLKGWL